MAEQAAAIRSYIKEVACAVPEFDGQKIHLQRFIKVIKLVDLAKGSYEDIAVEVIKSKIVGTILNSVDNETTIPAKYQNSTGSRDWQHYRCSDKRIHKNECKSYR